MKNNNIEDKLYKKEITLIDDLKNRIESNPNYFVFSDVDSQDETSIVLQRDLLEEYYIEANIALKHLDFYDAYDCFNILFKKAKLYKQIPIKYLISFSEALLCLNEILVCYDFVTFLYFNICLMHKEYEKEAKELFIFIKEIEKLAKDINNTKDTNILKDYIINEIITKENIIYKDDDTIINEMNEVTNIVSTFNYLGI